MTTETLQRLKTDYRAGTISRNDHEAMVDELIRRSEAVHDAKETLKERLGHIFDQFIDSIDTD